MLAQRVMVAAALLASALLLAGGAASLLLRSLAEPLAEAAWTEEQLERLIAEQERLTALGVFPTGRGTRDAGVALNRYLSGGSPADERPVWASLADLGEALLCPTAPESWIACFRDPGPEALDLSFMAALGQYDAWDPTSSGAWARYTKDHRSRGSLLFLERPDLLPLMNAARLRLLRGVHGGDVLPALREVRQLARLTWTLGTFHASVKSIEILSLEREVYEQAVGLGLLAAGDWAPLPEADEEAAKQAIWGMAALYAGSGSPDALARARAAAPWSRCAGLDEAIQAYLPVRGLFARPWPGEIDLTPRFALLDAAVREGSCPPTPEILAWQDEDSSFDRTFRDVETLLAHGVHLPTPLADIDRLRIALRLPWIRQIAGLALLSPVLASHNPPQDADR